MMRRLRVVFGLLGLGLVLAVPAPFAPSISLTEASAQGPDVPPHLKARAQREGAVRVIVELNLPAGPLVPEGEMFSGGQLLAQRRDIATAQSRVLLKLGKKIARVLHKYESVPLLVIEVDSDGLNDLESDHDVRQVFEDALAFPTLIDSAPLIQADQAWNVGQDGTGTVIAILDTGVDSSHPFLTGKVVEEACYSSTIPGQSASLCPNGQPQQTGTGSARPCSLLGCFHGTHVAGIAAGHGAGAGQAFSGVARGAQIMAIQVFSRITDRQACGGFPPCLGAFTSDIIAGLERVYARRTQHNLASVNMSLAGGLFSSRCDTQPHRAIIDNLRSVRIPSVAATGNNGSLTSIGSPACISSAVSVASTTKMDVVSSFSNVAPFLSLFAPGDDITSSVPGGSYSASSGTSMAAPHVAGGWAVLKQAAPSASVDSILSALQETGLLVTDTRGSGVTKPRVGLNQALSAL
ncbi:MAG: S8 family peptidase, partial [Acidimicrobiia bacterium]